MHSRLFVRVGGALRRGRISSEEEARPVPAPVPGICTHRFADQANRGRNCPDCGFPMIYVPGAAVA
jgi:hypothetical protein